MLKLNWKFFFTYSFIAILLTFFLMPLTGNYHVLSIVNSLQNEYGRIDFRITNSSNGGSITIINPDRSVIYSEPDWIKNKFGQGGVLKVKQGLSWRNHKIQLKSNRDCELSISFAGNDFRVNGKRYPVFSEYKNLQVNDIDIPLKQSVTWHDSRETHSLNLNDGKVVTVSFDVKRHIPKISDLRSDDIYFNWQSLLLVIAFNFFIANKFVNSFTWKDEKTAIKSNKIVYYDAIRVLSIIFVIFNHTDGFHYYLKAKETGIAEFFYVSLSVFTKFAVPMFFMLSGALLLEKTETLNIIFFKRVCRFVYITIFFTLFTTYIFYLYGNQITFDEIWRGILNRKLIGTVPYWFLYAYIGLLISLPFIRAIAAKMIKQEFILLSSINIFFSAILPLSNLILTYFKIESIEIAGYLKNTLQFVLTSAIFYPLTGYFIDKHVDINKLKRHHIIILLGSIIVAVAITAAATITYKNISGEFTQHLLGCLVFFIVVPLFLLVKKLFSIEAKTKVRGWVYSAISLVAPLTFFAYLIDIPLKRCISSYVFKLCGMENSPVIYSALWVITSLTISGIAAYILRKNTFIRKYI